VRNRILAADWVVTQTGAPIEKGVVVVEGAKIAWVGHEAGLPSQFARQAVDRFAGVITPGLVNAHTHLQYTGFAALGKRQFTSFEHWADEFEVEYLAVTSPDEWTRAAAQGVKLAINSGTTSLAEIITNDAARGALAAHFAGGIEYLEVISEIDRSWAGGGRDAFLQRLAAPSQSQVGISPHAPYSVDPDVITDLVRLAHDTDLRLHTHLGESGFEDALYEHGIPRVLDVFGDLRDEYVLVREGGRGMKAAVFADSIGLICPRCHIAHGVYFDRAQRDLLLAQGTQVALCPRSNAVIGLDRAPVADYLREGHEIAVGTDSLASSPSLDLMGDVKALAMIAREQGYEGDDLHARLIRAATVGGARAMGLADGYGRLVAGGPADLAAFALGVSGDRVEQALVEGAEGACVLTMAAGRVLFDARQSAARGDPAPVPAAFAKGDCDARH